MLDYSIHTYIHIYIYTHTHVCVCERAYLLCSKNAIKLRKKKTTTSTDNESQSATLAINRAVTVYLRLMKPLRFGPLLLGLVGWAYSSSFFFFLGFFKLGLI